MIFAPTTRASSEYLDFSEIEYVTAKARTGNICANSSNFYWWSLAPNCNCLSAPLHDLLQRCPSHCWQESKGNLKGSFTIFLFLVRSHILNSNGVWYSWFWPEGPINAQNSIFLGFKFVPRDLDSQRHMGPWLAAAADKIKIQKNWVWGVYRPLRPKSAIPHPITTQNMRSDQK